METSGATETSGETVTSGETETSGEADTEDTDPPPPFPDPNDPLFPEQEHLRTIRAPEAWAYTLGEGVRVAVFDNGFWADDPEMTHAYVGSEILFEDVLHQDSTTCMSHGSTIAATIAAQVNNETGLVGVAPDVEVLRISNGCPTWVGQHPPPSMDEQLASHIAYIDAILRQGANAIDQVVADCAQIINMSFVVPAPGEIPELDEGLEIFHQAIIRAVDAGALVVGAAGNWVGQREVGASEWEGVTRDQILYPAAFPEVVAAGCVCDGELCEWPVPGPALGLPSNMEALVAHHYGEGLDLVAPCDGVPIILKDGGGLEYLMKPEGGTSNAAPQVVGALALVWSAHPELSANEVVERLRDAATDLGEPGIDIETGHGLVNLATAIGAD